MTKRRFRYDKELDAMVEVPLTSDFEPTVSIHGDIQPFVSPRDGTVIRSRAHMAEYMARHNLIHFDATMTREEDRYADGHRDRALQELLYEKVDKMFQNPVVKRYLRDRR